MANGFLGDARKAGRQKTVAFTKDVDEESERRKKGVLRTASLPLDDSSLAISPSASSNVPKETDSERTERIFNELLSPIRPEGSPPDEFFDNLPSRSEAVLRGIELITSLSLAASLVYAGTDRMPSSTWLVVASLMTTAFLIRLCFKSKLPSSQIFAIDAVLLSFWFRLLGSYRVDTKCGITSFLDACSPSKGAPHIVDSASETWIRVSVMLFVVALIMSCIKDAIFTLWDYLVSRQADNELTPAKREQRAARNDEDADFESQNELESLLLSPTDVSHVSEVSVDSLRPITASLLTPDTPPNPAWVNLAYYGIHLTNTAICLMLLIRQMLTTGFGSDALLSGATAVISTFSLVPGFKRSSPLFLNLVLNALMLLAGEWMTIWYRGSTDVFVSGIMTVAGISYFALCVFFLNFKSS
jgi:hypothetical protein